MNHYDANYSQRYGQIKEAFRGPTEDEIPNPYIFDQHFRSTNVNAAGEATNEIGFKLFVFDIQYQENLETAQPIKAEFLFSKDVPAGINGYALNLTIIPVSISSDQQRHFDVI